MISLKTGYLLLRCDDFIYKCRQQVVPCINEKGRKEEKKFHQYSESDIGVLVTLFFSWCQLPILELGRLFTHTVYHVFSIKYSMP